MSGIYREDSFWFLASNDSHVLHLTYFRISKKCFRNMAGGSACTMLTDSNKDLKCNIKVGCTNIPKDSSVVGRYSQSVWGAIQFWQLPILYSVHACQLSYPGQGSPSIAFLGSIIDLIWEQKCFVNWIKAGKFNLEMWAIPMMASFDIYFTRIQKGTDCSILCGKD